jgi:hypothetical protein
LALNGSLDYQVTPEINFTWYGGRFRESEQRRYFKILPGLNHLFQNATAGSGAEYAQIEETLDPATQN